MSVTEIADGVHAGPNQLRNEPVQARSTARLAALLDAAAHVIDEVGYERLTTAMVADRAGASIGTVYRYFPDRIAVLQALGARNMERVLSNVEAEFRDERHNDWREALSAAFNGFVSGFRHEPGFRALRVGDVIDLRPAPSERTYNSVVAENLHRANVERFGLPDTEETEFAFEVCIEICDGLVSRAFAREAHGDQRFIDAAFDLVVTRIGALYDAADD